MAIFNKKEKTVAELEAELKGIELQRNIAAKRRALKKDILANKVGRATDILKEMYHGAKAVGNEVSKAYAPQNREKVRRMRNYLLNE